MAGLYLRQKKDLKWKYLPFSAYVSGGILLHTKTVKMGFRWKVYR